MKLKQTTIFPNSTPAVLKMRIMGLTLPFIGTICLGSRIIANGPPNGAPTTCMYSKSTSRGQSGVKRSSFLFDYM